MSQEELASSMQVSRQAVSKWENGISNPDTANLLRLAELFLVDIHELTGISDSKKTVHTEHQKSNNPKIMIHVLSILLAVSLCVSLLFALLWIEEKNGHTDKEMDATQPQNESRWESVRMYSYTGPLKTEIPLTEEEINELSVRIWNYYFTSKTDADADEPMKYGELKIYLEFIRNGIKYIWCFRTEEISCTVLLENGKSICHRYEADFNLITWIKTYAK